MEVDSKSVIEVIVGRKKVASIGIFDDTQTSVFDETRLSILDSPAFVSRLPSLRPCTDSVTLL